jgi:hypothetical protein
MRYLKIYEDFTRLVEKKYFSNEVLNIISDMVLDIGDLDDWYVQFWEDKYGLEFTGNYTVIIETKDNGSNDYRWSPKKVPSTVIETIETLIGYFDGEGYECEISFESSDTDEFMEVDINDIGDLSIWSNNFIRLQFKMTSHQEY